MRRSRHHQHGHGGAEQQEGAGIPLRSAHFAGLPHYFTIVEMKVPEAVKAKRTKRLADGGR
jgi:hypothetical protein